VGAVPQMAEFVDHRIFEHRLGCEDQMPVEVHDPICPAASPEVLLILDLNPLRLVIP
jgi:hypothetical protein